MKRRILFLIALECIFPVLTVQGEWLLNPLSELKANIRNQPVVVTKPNGGYVQFWEEQELVGEMRIDLRRHYYQVLDADANIVVPKQELKFWKSEGLPLYEYNENSIIFLDSNRLLITARKMVNLAGTYHLEKLIIDLSCGTISRDSNKIGFQNCTLIRSSIDNVYAIELGYSWLHYLEIVQVHPTFGKPKKLIAKHPQKHYMKHYLSSEDNAITMTSQNNLLVVGRVMSVAGKPVDESPDGWRGLPNRLACFLVDTTGNAKIESYEVDLTDVAFRKISGIHVGGVYRLKPRQATRDGLDFSHLPNGDIILSVTGLDKRGDFCMYQVRFNFAGELQKPSGFKEINPKPFPKDYSLPVMKVEPVVTYLADIPNRNKILTRREYILFGFDEEGNFYEERMVWKEGEE